MKAVILAAGEGRRLEPLTNRRPKPMLPIAGKPLLEYVLDACIDAGVDEFVFVVGYYRDRIQTYFGDGDDWNVDIQYAVQDKQLGTGHAVLCAEPYLDGEFVVLNGDRILDGDCIKDVLETREAHADPVVAVTRTANPQAYGVVELDGDRIASLVEKPRADAVSSDIINAGVYAFDSSVFDALRDTPADESGEVALTSALSALIEDGTVRAARYSGDWVDVTHLWDIPRVTASVLDGLDGGQHGTVVASSHVADATYVGHDSRVSANATVLRGTSLGDNVSIGANAVLSNTVVLSDTTVGEGAVLNDSVVAENAYVGPNVTVEGGAADVLVDGALHEDVTLGAVVGDNAHVGGGAVLAPGTVVGDGARIESGAYVTGRVPSDAEVRRG